MPCTEAKSVIALYRSLTPKLFKTDFTDGIVEEAQYVQSTFSFSECLACKEIANIFNDI